MLNGIIGAAGELVTRKQNIYLRIPGLAAISEASFMEFLRRPGSEFITTGAQSNGFPSIEEITEASEQREDQCLVAALRSSGGGYFVLQLVRTEKEYAEMIENTGLEKLALVWMPKVMVDY